MMSPAEFARKLERAAIRARNELDIPTEAVMLSVATEAKAVLGTYAYGWKPLAASTLAHKSTGDSPLLERGDTRASVEYKAELSPTGAEGLVYSNDKVALWQELGTVHIPARSFLFKSLWLATPVMAKAFGEFAIKILTFE